MSQRTSSRVAELAKWEEQHYDGELVLQIDQQIHVAPSPVGPVQMPVLNGQPLLFAEINQHVFSKKGSSAARRHVQNWRYNIRKKEEELVEASDSTNCWSSSNQRHTSWTHTYIAQGSPPPISVTSIPTTATPVTASDDSTSRRALTDDDGGTPSAPYPPLRQKEKFLSSNDGSQSPAMGKQASANRAKNKQTKGPLNNSMIRKASKRPSNPKRAPKKLSDAQLEKKRAQDRKAQRAARERRRILEKRLTEEKKELERQVTELTEGRTQLEAQIAVLQLQATHMGLLLQDRESLMGLEYTGTELAWEDQHEQKPTSAGTFPGEFANTQGESLSSRSISATATNQPESVATKGQYASSSLNVYHGSPSDDRQLRMFTTSEGSSIASSPAGSTSQNASPASSCTSQQSSGNHLSTSVHICETRTQPDPENLHTVFERDQEITVPQDTSPMQRCFAKLCSMLNAPPFINCVDESPKVENLRDLVVKGLCEAGVLPSDDPGRTVNLLQLLAQIVVGAKSTLQKMSNRGIDSFPASNVRDAEVQINTIAVALHNHFEKCRRRIQKPDSGPNSHTRHTVGGVQGLRELPTNSPQASQELILGPKQDNKQTHQAVVGGGMGQSTTKIRQLFCTHCNRHPRGFTKRSSLNDHISRYHNTFRSVWICKDNSENCNVRPNKSFADCQQCCTRKEYSALKSAIKHLKVIHFASPQIKRGNRKVSDKQRETGEKQLSHQEELKHWILEVRQSNETVLASESSIGTKGPGPLENYRSDPLYQTTKDKNIHLKPIVCNECKKTFRGNWDLRRHWNRVHVSEGSNRDQ